MTVQIGTCGYRYYDPGEDWRETYESSLHAYSEDVFDLVHIVDLLRHDPVSSHEVAYVRLHGLNEDPYDYDYDYSTSELEDLAGKLGNLDEAHDTVYCLFNNHAKFENARELAEML